MQIDTSQVQFTLSISIWDTLYNIHTTYMNALPFYSSLGYRRSGRQFDEDEVYSGTSTTQQGKLECIDFHAGRFDSQYFPIYSILASRHRQIWLQKFTHILYILDLYITLGLAQGKIDCISLSHREIWIQYFPTF